jgi:hypothetical protein
MCGIKFGVRSGSAQCALTKNILHSEKIATQAFRINFMVLNFAPALRRDHTYCQLSNAIMIIIWHALANMLCSASYSPGSRFIHEFREIYAEISHSKVHHLEYYI